MFLVSYVFFPLIWYSVRAIEVDHWVGAVQSFANGQNLVNLVGCVMLDIEVDSILGSVYG